MDFKTCMESNRDILMEGALGERLKREYGIVFDDFVAMAGLIYDRQGAAALTALWQGYMEIARAHQLPFLATTPTRRANRERVRASGFSEGIIGDNVAFLKNIRSGSGLEMYVGGLVGCKGDAYTGEGALSEEEAVEFHSWTVEQFQQAGADFIYAGIMPTLPEAAGLARAIEPSGLPYMISFTIRQDGKLIDGTTVAEAIGYIDSITKTGPVCYMSNCVHPTIVHQALSQPFNDVPLVKGRFRGIQANTSPLSLDQLDGSAQLHCSEPEDFARDMMKLREIGSFRIWGGCCGTDERHMRCVAEKLKKQG